MSWIKEILEAIGWVTKTAINERTIDYRSSYLRNQDVLTQVTLEIDRALMTFSIGALAALVALNDKIFQPYGWLSFVTFGCFAGVVVFVIFGYFFTRGMIVDVQKIITKNYKKSSSTPLSEGMERAKYVNTTKIINFINLVLFIAGILLFLLLVGLYIGGIH